MRERPLRVGLCDAQGSHPQADDTQQDHRSVEGSELGRGAGLRRVGIQAHPEKIRARLDRRHRLLALHQRGRLSGAETGARRVRQQQRRHLRAGVPFADRLWPETDAGRIRRDADVQIGRAQRCDHGDRREPDRCPSGVRLADEEAPARRGEADRDRSAPYRPGALAACRGGFSFAAQTRHQCGDAFRAGACDRHRGSAGDRIHRAALRGQGLPAMA